MNTKSLVCMRVDSWPLFKLVGLGRVELPTSPLSGVRSNQLSYRPHGNTGWKACATKLVELVGIEPATS